MLSYHADSNVYSWEIMQVFPWTLYASGELFSFLNLGNFSKEKNLVCC